MPKPKKAFQSPGTQKRSIPRPVVVVIVDIALLLLLCGSLHAASASITASDFDTQPKMPPWALIIFRPMAWNSGK